MNPALTNQLVLAANAKEQVTILKVIEHPIHTGFQWILVWFLKIYQELRPQDYYSSFKNTIPKRNILVPRSIRKFDFI